MDHFIEDDHDLFSEKEAENILYSLVHHDRNQSKNITKCNSGNEYPVSRKNKALRWNSVQSYSDSSDVVGRFSHSIKSNEILDYVPLDGSTKTDSNVSSNKNSFVERNSRNNKGNKRNGNRSKVPYIRSLVSVNIVDRDVKKKPLDSPQNNFSMSTKSISPQVNKNMLLKSACSQNFTAVDNGVSKSVKEQVDCRRKESNPINVNHDFINSKSNETTQKFQDDMNQIIKNVESVQQSSDEDVIIVHVSDEINQSTGSVHFIGEHKDSPDILTLSDSESSIASITEVSIPPKPCPILIALDSSDEIEKGAVTVPNCISNVNNICLNNDKKVKIKTDLYLANLVSVSQNECNILQRTDKGSDNISHCTSSNTPEFVKKKNSRKTKQRFCLENSMPCTISMHQFYNHSWGGETFDHVKVQQAMTDNPSKWQILEVDKYGPLKATGPLAKVRCANCHQFGHLARMCPDPHKIKSCFMCGIPGHNEFKCPYKICLKCGRPAPLYNSGCPLCWSKDHPPNCSTCGDKEHYSWMCPSVWRKLHSVTTAEEMNTINSQVAVYKPRKNQSCCYCARQGHNATCCPFLSQPCKSNFFIDPSYSRSPRGKKKRKTRNSALSWKWGDDFHRKRRKTN